MGLGLWSRKLSPCGWVESFSIRLCLAMLFYVKKKNIFFYVLKLRLPNTTLINFLSVWFLVKSVFSKYALFDFSAMFIFYFFVFFPNKPQIIFKKFQKNSKIILKLFMSFSHIFPTISLNIRVIDLYYKIPIRY